MDRIDRAGKSFDEYHYYPVGSIWETPGKLIADACSVQQPPTSMTKLLSWL
jgi:hypothetical protein